MIKVLVVLLVLLLVVGGLVLAYFLLTKSKCGKCPKGRKCNFMSGCECPKNCSRHGKCDTKMGTCACTGPWQGDDCSVPKKCPGDPECGGPNQGNCVDGSCVCLDGWAEKDCSRAICPGDPECSGPDNGECKNGSCVCAKGWTGEDCSQEADKLPEWVQKIWGALKLAVQGVCPNLRPEMVLAVIAKVKAEGIKDLKKLTVALIEECKKEPANAMSYEDYQDYQGENQTQSGAPHQYTYPGGGCPY